MKNLWISSRVLFFFPPQEFGRESCLCAQIPSPSIYTLYPVFHSILCLVRDVPVSARGRNKLATAWPDVVIRRQRIFIARKKKINKIIYYITRIRKNVHFTVIYGLAYIYIYVLSARGNFLPPFVIRARPIYNLFRRSRSFIYVKIPVGTRKDEVFNSRPPAAAAAVASSSRPSSSPPRLFGIEKGYFYFIFFFYVWDFTKRVESLIYGDTNAVLYTSLVARSAPAAAGNATTAAWRHYRQPSL